MSETQPLTSPTIEELKADRKYALDFAVGSVVMLGVSLAAIYGSITHKFDQDGYVVGGALVGPSAGLAGFSVKNLFTIRAKLAAARAEQAPNDQVESTDDQAESAEQ